VIKSTHGWQAMGWGLVALALALLCSHGIGVLYNYLEGCFNVR
jgi:hypothetical protein